MKTIPLWQGHSPLKNSARGWRTTTQPPMREM